MAASGRASTAILRLSGTKWSVSPTPALAANVSGVLDGVSCTTAAACTTVGQTSSFNAGPTFFDAPLVEASA